ncbi:MAG TPA: aminotransferase class I/II-fold pyridoxal phosphate-dependent enzyme [Longimicrobiales bacterium]|nr:aminotransferase class I/II-fold pyridoxal phosphate-dependent enzyme [Longimicrobiales bacterium]
MTRLASRFNDFPPYPLVEVPRIKRELRAKGVDVIDLGAGDADLAAPPAVIEALAAAAADPAMSRYPFQLGLPELREEIARWMQSRFGVALDPYAELLPLIGSKEGIGHLALAYVESGDATIVPDPGYAPYLGGTLLAGGEPVMVPIRPENDFLIDLDAMPRAVARRTRIVYLNYPNNPTAAIAPLDYMKRAVDWCREHDATLAWDNAYSELAFEEYTPPSILEIDGARDVAVEFHSFSKTYNMTGWRLGWAAGGSDAIAALSRVKSFVDTGVFLAVQAAGVAALRSHATWVPGNVRVFHERRDALVGALHAQGFEVESPKATMYVWMPVPAGEPSADFARRALVEQGIVVMPGSALGAGGEGFVRIALTQSAERLELAAVRLGEVAVRVARAGEPR